MTRPPSAGTSPALSPSYFVLLVFQLIAVMLVALAAALSAAHAFEMPGKMRLSRDDYLVVQKIYYPGFTIGGIGEVLAVIATAALLFVTPAGTAAFWLTLAAFLASAAMQAVYWLRTHPVNRVWLEGEKLSAAGSGFFAAGGRLGEAKDWTALRDRWEHSHLARAILGAVALLALVAAVGLS